MKMMNSILSCLDFVYLAFLWAGIVCLANKKTVGWPLQVLGSMLGVVYGYYLSTISDTGFGLAAWNCVFMLAAIWGWREWAKKDKDNCKNWKTQETTREDYQ